MKMMKKLQSIRIIFLDGFKYVKIYKNNKRLKEQVSFYFELFFVLLFIYFFK